LITILGPTASGKTDLAARLAFELNGEVISADSRQVYRGMNIGTGKDYDDYLVQGTRIPVHLIDIVDPGYEYNIFEFQKDFSAAYEEITVRGKTPILCGGSGMYLEAIIKNYCLRPAQKDEEFERSLEKKTDEELRDLLLDLRVPHNSTDLLDRKRTIRAIMISSSPEKTFKQPLPVSISDPIVFGIRFDREILRKRITARLEKRLQNGMVEEAESLINGGLTWEQLKFYGLEYRYLTMFIKKEIDHAQMFRLLNTAIHQFAKRQMTWFRKMERNGLTIHWIDGALETDDKISYIIAFLRQAQK
jgi:tRNA dimethylallyltransferase